MAGENGWSEYKIHVMSEIQELKESQKDMHAQLSEISTQLTGFKTSQKWEARILSAFWGLIVLGINFIVGRHHQ